MAKVTVHNPKPIPTPPATFTLELSEDEFVALAWLTYRTIQAGPGLANSILSAADEAGLMDKVYDKAKPKHVARYV